MSGDSPTRESMDVREILSRYKPDTVIHGYRVVRHESIPEINSVAILLVHQHTGLEHLHIATNDRENAFILATRTVPDNSKGTTRVLERLVMRGSDKFPCRDILCDRMKQTSQHAYIGVSRLVDCTFYPVVTQIKKELLQWMDVLMDSVFRPRLEEYEFMKEAWHVKIINEQTREYALGGQTYTSCINFMMNTQAVMHHKMVNLLFPSHAYRHVVQGLPNEILTLTHQDVLEYHTKYYQPSNATAFTYGDIPLDEILYVEDSLLREMFPDKPPSSVSLDISDEPPWRQSKEITLPFLPYPGDDELNYGAVAIGYRLEDTGKIYDNFCLRALTLMLLNGKGAIIPKAFMDSSEITHGIVSDSGFDCSLQTSYLTIGLQRAQIDQIEIAVDIINEALFKIIREGIDKQFVEDTLRQLEITFKKRDSMFGLKLFRQIIGVWNHNPDPIEALKFDSLMDRLKRDTVANPRFFYDLLAKHLIYNPHRVIISMIPDSNFVVPRGQLPVSISDMTNEQIADMKRRYEAYKEWDQKPLNDECLPRLTFEDYPTDVTPSPEMLNMFSNVPVCLYPQATNGLLYFRMILDVSHVSENLQSVVPLFCQLFSSIGNSIRGQVRATVGDLNASAFIASDPREPNQVEKGILFYSYCLQKDAEQMFKLWARIFGEWEPSDARKTRTLAQEMIGSVFNNPTAFLHMAWKVSARTLHPFGWASEKVAGFNFFRMVADAEETTNYTELMGHLAAMKSMVMNKSRMRCAMTGPLESMEKNVKHLKTFLETLGPRIPNSDIPASNLQCRQTFHDEVKVGQFCKPMVNLLFPFPDHIMAMSMAMPPYGTEEFAAMLVAAKIIDKKCETGLVPHAEVGVAIQPPGSSMTIYSKRDPQPLTTVQMFLAELKKITEGDIPAELLDEAKRLAYHEESAPVPPGIRGMDKFMNGFSEEMKCTQMRAIFSTTTEQVASVAKKQLMNEKGDFVYGVCVIGKKLYVPDPENWDYQFLAPI